MARSVPAMPAAPPLRSRRFLTVAEVAGRLRVSKMTVYRLIHSGALAAYRISNCFRVAESALDEYIEKSQMDA